MDSSCEGCPGRSKCIVDIFNERRLKKIADGGEAAEVELAIGVIREKENYLRSLRQDLDSRLMLFRLGKSAEAIG